MNTILTLVLVLVALVAFAAIVLKRWQKRVNEPSPPPAIAPRVESAPPPAQPVAPSPAPAPQPPAQVIDNISDLLFKPSPEVGAILDARVGTGGGVALAEEPFPATFVRRRVRCRLEAGAVYTCAFAEPGGYMVAVGEGQGTRLVAWVAGQPEPLFEQGAVDVAQFHGEPGQVWCLKAEKSCVIWLDA